MRVQSLRGVDSSPMVIDDYARHLGPIGVALYVALARNANHHTGQCGPCVVGSTGHGTSCRGVAQARAMHRGRQSTTGK